MLIHRELLAMLLVLLVLLVLALEGRVHAAEIIGGREAVPHSRPYMALLNLHKKDGPTQYCGGFLLNADFVMTAAHCQARSFTVFLGLHNIKESYGQPRITVEQAFPHKGYNASNYINDIMLLKLSSKANFTQNVRPIALADHSDVSLPRSCLVSGWGAGTERNQYLSEVLMEVDVTLVDRKQCAEKHLYCSEEKTGLSKGDSGGPLVCDGKAYGVVSSTFTPKSGAPKINCFAKIPDVGRWIRSTMADALKRPRYAPRLIDQLPPS
ncbi:granzyme B(G,H)-like [Cyclopterus lumpus]|uniref:trypsin n=1 Tax=Cyclopterus lumpus TaxID=8103 RepID=A0A8C2WDE0_CYCLU|nr:granzyme B(G,H)-like [Cyclopterus lumpus]